MAFCPAFAVVLSLSLWRFFDPAPLGENQISSSLGAPQPPRRSSSALGAPAAWGSRARALPFPSPGSGRISSPLGAPAALGS